MLDGLGPDPWEGVKHMKKAGKKDAQKLLVKKAVKEDEKDDGRLHPIISDVPIKDRSDYIFWKDELDND